jgi:outer membrane protein insertion porin family
MTQAGTVYNEEFLKKDLAKVFSTQIFDEVNRELAPSEENPGTFDVTVIVKEKSTNSVALGGGIDTGLGAFGSISLREDNFLGKAQKVSLSGILGSGILLSDASIKNHMNYQVELSFFEPYFINADNSLMSKIYYREMGSWNVPLAIERRIGANIGVEHKVKGYDKLYTSFTLGAEHINLKEGDFNRVESLYKQHGLNISERAKQLSD